MVDEESGGFFEKIGKMFGGKEEEENRAEVAKQVLKDVQAEIGFKIGEGKKIIVGLRELGDYLATISEDDFEKHVNENKNDISWWVTNSVGDRVLGERLKKIKDSAQMANEVYSRVKELTPYLSNKEEGINNKEEGISKGRRYKQQGRRAGKEGRREKYFRCGD